MDSYNAFASYYDGLMEDARYEERCRYILEAAQRFGHPMGRTLDLACGTGSLTLLLRQSGVDVFGADASGVPDGHDGIVAFSGDPVAFVTGAGVNDAREMTVSIALSSEFTYPESITIS